MLIKITPKRGFKKSRSFLFSQARCETVATRVLGTLSPSNTPPPAPERHFHAALAPRIPSMVQGASFSAARRFLMLGIKCLGETGLMRCPISGPAVVVVGHGRVFMPPCSPPAPAPPCGTSATGRVPPAPLPPATAGDWLAASSRARCN